MRQFFVTVQPGSEDNVGELLEKKRTGSASSRSLPCGKLPFPRPLKNFKTFIYRPEHLPIVCLMLFSGESTLPVPNVTETQSPRIYSQDPMTPLLHWQIGFCHISAVDVGWVTVRGLECYTISRVDKNPKFGITRGKETQKEGKKNDDLQQRIQRRSDPAVR